MNVFKLTFVVTFKDGVAWESALQCNSSFFWKEEKENFSCREMKKRREKRKLLSGEKNIIIILLSFCGFSCDGKQSRTESMDFSLPPFFFFVAFQLFSLSYYLVDWSKSLWSYFFNFLFPFTKHFTVKHQMWARSSLLWIIFHVNVSHGCKRNQMEP